MLADTGASPASEAVKRAQTAQACLRWSAGRRRPHTNGGGGLTSLRRGRSQGSAKGGLANLLAPPGAPSPAAAGRKKGKDAPASIKTGPAERWLRALGLHKGVQRFIFSYGAAPHHSS